MTQVVLSDVVVFGTLMLLVATGVGSAFALLLSRYDAHLMQYEGARDFSRPFFLPFWSLLEPPEVESMEAQVGTEMPTRITLPLAQFMYLFALIILINLLIAAMTETYQRLRDSSSLYWMNERAKLTEEFKRKGALPPPPSTSCRCFSTTCPVLSKLCSRDARHRWAGGSLRAWARGQPPRHLTMASSCCRGPSSSGSSTGVAVRCSSATCAGAPRSNGSGSSLKSRLSTSTSPKASICTTRRSTTSDSSSLRTVANGTASSASGSPTIKAQVKVAPPPLRPRVLSAGALRVSSACASAGSPTVGSPGITPGLPLGASSTTPHVRLSHVLRLGRAASSGPPPPSKPPRQRQWPVAQQPCAQTVQGG